MRFGLVALLSVFAATAAHAAEAEAKQRLFERVFKDATKLDPAMVARVKAAKPGQYVFADTNGDGRHDECWFIDISPRHRTSARPLLVRVIDEDGDMHNHKAPDLDSDLYVADWKADGTVDAVTDYQDDDRDGDLDQMGIYYWSPKDHFLGKDALRVWWSRDDGDDNQLWYDVDYTYDQGLCQWRCHFSGDESFVAFGLTEDSDHWISIWENPFLFYDPDKDDCSEEVIRFSGLADQVEALRWSFDADDDAYGRRTHDYDFSITAIAPGSRWLTDGKTAASDLKIPAAITEKTTLRGLPTGGWLRRDKAREFARDATWAKVLLTWDEINANTDADVARDPHERWEGVIARGNKDFPQVGGPPVSAFNKRNELSLTPQQPLRVYWSGADHRLHLFGARQGWLDIDYDFDGKLDAKYEWIDQDADGYFDRQQIDVDADGSPDIQRRVGRLADVPLDLPSVQAYAALDHLSTLGDFHLFVRAAESVLRDSSGSAGPVKQFVASGLASWGAATGLGKHTQSSYAGRTFYLELVSNRLFVELRRTHSSHGKWSSIEDAYLDGRLADAAQQVRELLLEGRVADAPEDAEFPRAFSVLVVSQGSAPVDRFPVAVSLRELHASFPDFNPEYCKVVTPDDGIMPLELQHQLDEADKAIGPTLSFISDAGSQKCQRFRVCYNPVGKRAGQTPARTATAEDWVPPNIGWESDRSGYRAYWGQFDFFGKKIEHLIYPTIGKTSYHAETEWGIDALHVGKASGLGGLTLYIGEKAYPVQNPAGDGKVEFTKRQICAGPVRAAIEITARNIAPEKPDIAVRMLCLAYAERQESEIRVRLTGTDEPVMLAPGLVKLPREQFFAEPKQGFIGSWGWQEAAIGEIGMAIIADPERVVDVVDDKEERRMRCRLDEEGELRYWIIGDWQRGRQYPVAPTGTNWRSEVGALAKELLDGAKIEIGQPMHMNQ